LGFNDAFSAEEAITAMLVNRAAHSVDRPTSYVPRTSYDIWG